MQSSNIKMNQKYSAPYQDVLNVISFIIEYEFVSVPPKKNPDFLLEKNYSMISYLAEIVLYFSRNPYVEYKMGDKNDTCTSKLMRKQCIVYK